MQKSDPKELLNLIFSTPQCSKWILTLHDDRRHHHPTAWDFQKHEFPKLTMYIYWMYIAGHMHDDFRFTGITRPSEILDEVFTVLPPAAL